MNGGGEMRKKGQSRKRLSFCWRQDYGFRDQEPRRGWRPVCSKTDPRRLQPLTGSGYVTLPVDSNGY